MVNPDLPMYDIGTLKDDPVSLYDLAMMLWEADAHAAWDTSSECWKALKTVINSLWGNMPPVVTIDLRDPDDPRTWGRFGPPPGITPVS